MTISKQDALKMLDDTWMCGADLDRGPARRAAVRAYIAASVTETDSVLTDAEWDVVEAHVAKWIGAEMAVNVCSYIGDKIADKLASVPPSVTEARLDSRMETHHNV